jgi:hypothetical protein
MNQLPSLRPDSEPLVDFALQGQAYGNLMETLSKVSGKERLALLKAVAGAFGHRVLPGLGTGGPQVPGVPRVGQRLKAPPQLRSRKSAKQTETVAAIKAINAKIVVESSSTGLRLEDNHPLIEERQRLFRALQAEKDAGGSPHGGERTEHP